MILHSDIIKATLTINNEKKEVIFKPSDTLAHVIREAFYLARSGRPGP